MLCQGKTPINVSGEGFRHSQRLCMLRREMALPMDSSAPVILAIVCNSLPPYRLHLHRRIIAEMPVKLWTINTHEGDDARWRDEPPQDINPVSFRSIDGEFACHQFSWRSFLKGGRIIHWFGQNRVNAVVVMGYNDAARLRCIAWCQRQGIPCFVFGDSNIKGDNPRGIAALLKRLLVGWVVYNARGVFACGRLGAQYFEKYGARGETTYFFPYEPDYDEIQKSSRCFVDEMITKYCLRPARRLVFSGRFVVEKQPEMVIEAFAQIAAQRPNWDLLMIGDGPMREQLRRLVPEHLAERVQWTGFISRQAEVSALYKASDVLVLPSKYEPWALVVNEAAAAGMAIVASNVVGAAAELVRDGVNGRLFAPDRLDQLVECLLDVTSNDRIDAMRSASLDVLSEWRRIGDPVNGLRKALADSGLKV